MRLVPVFIGAWLAAWPLSAAARDAGGLRVAASTTLEYVAEKGTKPEILGMGFDAKLSSVDGDGNKHRVYPLEFTTDEDEEFSSYYSRVEDSLSFSAHGRYLFAKAGIKATTTHRYVVIGAQHVVKTLHLEPKGQPQWGSALYASKINYGWAVYIVIEGDASTFTAEIAADLLHAGGSARVEAERRGLTVYTKLIGLTPKDEGGVVIPTSVEDIVRDFKQGKKPVPISVEYTAVSDFDVDAIPWELPGLAAGRYAVDVSVQIAKTDTRGQDWDLDSTRPDPAVQVIVNGAIVATCRKYNTVKAECSGNFVIVDLTDTTKFKLNVVEYDDFDANDQCGSTAEVTLVGARVVAGIPFQLPTSGQVASAVITLHAVR